MNRKYRKADKFEGKISEREEDRKGKEENGKE